MKGLAIFLNIALPGVGSFVVGKAGQGIAQILLWGFGLLLTIGTLGIGGIVGIPLMIAVWIWGIITATGAGTQTFEVNDVNSDAKTGAKQ